MSGFSSALKLTDLNDFIQPSQVCVKPVESGRVASDPIGTERRSKNDTISDTRQTSPTEHGGDTKIVINKSKSWKERAALRKGETKDIDNEDDVRSKLESQAATTPLSVTLGDCLACSGCITSAEAVLVAEQSHTKVLELLEQRAESQVFVLSMSLQSLASLAVKNRLPVQECAERMASFFRSIGIDYVLDIALARHICLIESAKELVQSMAQHKDRPSSAKTPILSSTCPGFVCYAEKSQGPILVPALSRVKSPQQIMGLLVKQRFDLFQRQQSTISTKSIVHITLMPCYDKKLEASRNDNKLDGNIPEVDCVITPIELEKLFEIKTGRTVCLEDFPRTQLDNFGTEFDQDFIVKSHSGSGSGGYAENLFMYTANELFDMFPEHLEWKQIRNADYLELKLVSSTENRELLSFAILNGFRNVQNLVSKFKRKTAQYDYIEVSACPKGCLNGGAQIRDVPYDESINSGQKNAEPWQISYEQSDNAYKNLPKTEFSLIHGNDNSERSKLNRELYEKLRIDEQFQKSLRTDFHVIEKTFNILNSNW